MRLGFALALAIAASPAGAAPPSVASAQASSGVTTAQIRTGRPSTALPHRPAIPRPPQSAAPIAPVTPRAGATVRPGGGTVFTRPPPPVLHTPEVDIDTSPTPPRGPDCLRRPVRVYSERTGTYVTQMQMSCRRPGG